MRGDRKEREIVKRTIDGTVVQGRPAVGVALGEDLRTSLIDDDGDAVDGLELASNVKGCFEVGTSAVDVSSLGHEELEHSRSVELDGPQKSKETFVILFVQQVVSSRLQDHLAPFDVTPRTRHSQLICFPPLLSVLLHLLKRRGASHKKKKKKDVEDERGGERDGGQEAVKVKMIEKMRIKPAGVSWTSGVSLIVAVSV